MAFVRQATDSFGRANGALNALGWTTFSNAINIASRALNPSAVNLDCRSFFSTGYWSPDQYAEVQVGALNNSFANLSPTVRSLTASGGSYYVLSIPGPLASATCTIFKFVTGTYTAISGALSFPATLAVGDIVRLSVQGTTLTVTQNGNLVGTVSDASIASGVPGVRMIVATGGAAADATITNWSAGYYTVLPNAIPNPFVPQGPVVFTNSEASSPYGVYAGNPTVIYDTSPQILTGAAHVFKMWYGAEGVSYCESLDGLTWTQHPSNPLIGSAVQTQGFPEVFKHGSTYYLYVTSHTSTTAQIDCYTAPDGVTWTLQLANCLGATQPWEQAGCWQLVVVGVIGGTWYGYYAGEGALATPTWHGGLATSADGITWTKNAGNPIIASTQCPQTFAKAGNTYYGWYPANLAVPGTGQVTGVLRLISASNPSGPWTLAPLDPVYYAATTGDLWYGVLSCPVDPCILEVNGKTYLYYTITQDGIAAGVGLAIANMTIAQLLTTKQGVQDAPIPGGSVLNFATLNTDNFARANSNPIGGNWTPLGSTGGFGNAQLISNLFESSAINVDGTSWYAGTFDPNQWAQVTVAADSGSSVGVALRCASGGVITMYRFNWSGTLGASGTWTLQKYVNGTATSFLTGALTVNVGDTLAIAAVGPNVYAYWNNVPVYMVSDSSITSGNPGANVLPAVAVGNAAVSNFSAGRFAAAPPNPPSGGGDVGPGFDFHFHL